MSNLEKLGFTRVGNTPFYRLFPYIIYENPNGIYSIWTDQFLLSERGGYKAITKWKSSIISKEDIGMIQNNSRWNGLTGGACDYTGDNSIFSIDPSEQALRVGLYPIIPQQVFASEKDFATATFIMIVENGIITAFGKLFSADRYAITHIHSKRREKSNWGGFYTYLRVENSFIEFEISKYGITENSQQLKREPTAKELGLVLPSYEFKKPISQILQINGKRFKKIEAAILKDRNSHQPDTSLHMQIQIDDDYVQSHGQTHTDLAYVLGFIRNFVVKGYGKVCLLNGETYHVSDESFRMWFYSYIDDDLVDDTFITVYKNDYASRMQYCAFMPELIAKYGYYGWGPSNRMSPKEIMYMFNLKK